MHDFAVETFKYYIPGGILLGSWLSVGLALGLAFDPKVPRADRNAARCVVGVCVASLLYLAGWALFG